MISAFGVDHGGISKRDDRRKGQYVAAGAAGAGAGSLAMPVRRKNNSSYNPFKNFPEGVTRDVPMSDIHSVARKTGKRMENKRYTAKLASDNPASMKAPTEFHVYDDGSTRQMSGAHRVWANTMRGETKGDVDIKRVAGPRPTVPLAERVYSDIGDKIHARRLKKGKKTPEQLKAQGDKLTPRAVEFNRKRTEKKVKAQGGVETHHPKPGMSNKALRGRQAAWLAGGTAVGLGGKAAYDSTRRRY